MIENFTKYNNSSGRTENIPEVQDSHCRATPVSGEVLGRHMKKMRWTNRSVLGRNSALSEEKYFALEEE